MQLSIPKSSLQQGLAFCTTVLIGMASACRTTTDVTRLSDQSLSDEGGVTLENLHLTDIDFDQIKAGLINALKLRPVEGMYSRAADYRFDTRSAIKRAADALTPKRADVPRPSYHALEAKIFGASRGSSAADHSLHPILNERLNVVKKSITMRGDAESGTEGFWGTESIKIEMSLLLYQGQGNLIGQFDLQVKFLRDPVTNRARFIPDLELLRSAPAGIKPFQGKVLLRNQVLAIESESRVVLMQLNETFDIEVTEKLPNGQTRVIAIHKGGAKFQPGDRI